MDNAIMDDLGTMKETLAHYGLTSLSSGFFWIIVFATLIGIVLSFTKLKNYEGV